MKKIFKILRKSWTSILLVIILLFIQANCDLALPDYTSNIINVGIQQSGIDTNIFEAIRENKMNNIMIFSNNEQDKILEENYELIEKGNKEYIKNYPILKDENIYILKEKYDKEKLEKIFNETLLMTYVFSSEEMAPMIKQQMNISNEINVMDVLKNLDDSKITEIKDNVSKKMDELSDTMINQITINIVKNEYKEIGINIEQIQTKYILNSGLQMILLAFIIMAIAITVSYLTSKIGSKLSKELRSQVVSKVMSYSNKEFEQLSTSSLITRSTNDINQVQMLVIMLLRIVIYAPILGFGALGKVSKTPMEWIIGVAVLSILSLVIIIFSLAMPKFKKLQQLVDKVNLVFREILTGIPVIRAFATEKYEEKKFDKANTDLTKTNLFVNKVMTFMMPTMMLIMCATQVLIVWVGAKNVDLGNIQVGDLLAFITYTMQIIMSFLMISMVSIVLPRSWVSVKRIAEVFNLDSSVKDPINPVKFKNLKGVVEFKDVYFRYPDAEEDVLENISFTANPGTTTAFIGSTGSGKSTLINLIPRFFDVTGGKILIDGINIKDVTLHDLREIIGFVPQKGVLFSGTIKSNIMFGKKISKKEMEKVASIAQASEFIESKDDKYDSSISQGGTNISGGQKQRLAIARAIAKNPKIYVFDDSFSALDYKTDANLRKMLKKETKDSTIFIVAQRINTIMHADQIIVLDEGRIVGIGTHKELLKKCEIYKEIALSQLSKEELENE